MSVEIPKTLSPEILRPGRYQGGELTSMESEERDHYLLATRERVEPVSIDRSYAQTADDGLSIHSSEYGTALSLHIADVSSDIEIGGREDARAGLVGRTSYKSDGGIERSMLTDYRLDRLNLKRAGTKPSISTDLVFDRACEVSMVRTYRSYSENRSCISFKDLDTLIRGGSDLPWCHDLESLGTVLYAKHSGNGLSSRKPHPLPADKLVAAVTVFTQRQVAKLFKERAVPGIYFQPGNSHGDKGRLSVDPEQSETARIQMTSPLRRYADLINQRMLIAAVIEDRPRDEWPYDEDTLLPIVESLNKHRQR